MSSFGAADRVVGGGELDAGDVLEAHHLAVAGFPDDDVLEFGGGGETALDEHRVLHLLPLRNGRQAEAAGGRDDVLLAYDAGDVGGGDAEPGHALRVEPDAHAVVAGAEDANLSDAGHPAQRVVQVEQRVVAQEYGVVAALGDVSAITSRKSVVDLRTVMPLRMTSAGSWLCAIATRF